MSSLRFSAFIKGVVCATTLAALTLPAVADGHGRFNWTGGYLGVHGGIGVGDVESTPTALSIPGLFVGPIPAGIASFFSSDFEMAGATYGGHLGYNFQTGNFVIGLEGSYSGSSINGDGPAGIGLIVADGEVDWMASISGRVGYAMDRSLVYVKAGVTWADIESAVRLGGITVMNGEETHVGWNVGLGFEHAFTQNLTFRIEYAHIDLGSENHTLTYNGALGAAPVPISLNADVDMTVDTINIGVSYKF